MKLIINTITNYSIRVVCCVCTVLLTFSQIKAQTLLTESFNYTPGTLLTANTWTALAGTGVNNIAVSSGNLSSAGSIGNGMGGKVPLSNNGQDVYRVFTSTAASVYSSLIVNVSAANAVGDFFYSIGTSAAPASTVGAKLFVRSNGAGFSFGVLRGSGGTPVYESTVRPFNSDIMVVLKYEVIAGATNDAVKLYVNPSLSSEPGTADVEYSATAGGETATLSGIALLQGTAANAPTLEVDGINVGSNWSSVTSAVYDYGDVPTSYDFTKDGVYAPAGNGLVSGLALGSTAPDLEISPLSVAAGANNNGSNGDGLDEDAIDVSVNQIRAGVPYRLSIPVTNPLAATRYVYGWIDFNNDGKFQVEEVATTTFFTIGSTTQTLSWTGAQTGTIISGASKLYMRLRLSDRSLNDFTTAASGGALIDERSVGNGAVSTANAADFGVASNGEVEDYQIDVVTTYDYGDVPSSFENDKDGNSLPALHAPLTGFSIGSLLDVENTPASITSPAENNTSGDNAVGLADEDGLTTLTSVSRGVAYSLTVPVNIPSSLAGTKYLYGWLDLNGDGRFQIGEVASITTAATTAANLTLTWTAAQTATLVSGTTKVYLRLRLSNLSLADFTTAASGGALIDERSIGNGATSTANAVNNPNTAFGEIEDYQLPVDLYDFGDVPISYDNSKDGVFLPAGHIQLSGFSLGSILPDVEQGPFSVAAGANNNGSNGDGLDEDAIDVSVNQIRAGVPYTLSVPVNNPVATTKYIYGWIDFNNDGKFQVGEVATTTFSAVGSTSQTLNWTGAQTGTMVSGVSKLYMRLRLSDRSLNDFTTAASGGALIDERSVGNGAVSTANAADFGVASNGEVEDYQIDVVTTYDYGDVPLSFENDKDGNPLPALHAPLTGFSIGSLLDIENAPASVASHAENNISGDNTIGIADEDGLTTMGNIERGLPYSLTIPVNIPSNLTGAKYLYGWLDLNDDGIFQLGEVATATTTGVANTTMTLTWTAAQTATIVNGTLTAYLRLRLSNLSLIDFTTAANGGALIDERSVGNGATSTVVATNAPNIAFGEVEDYQLPVISTIRYNDVIQGGVTLTGNSWYYSVAANPTGRLIPDIDGDASTTWSTSGDLILPAGSTVEKAFLSVEKDGGANFTSAMLKVPGSTTYTTLTPGTSIANRTSGGSYAQMIWDITSMIPANGYASTAGGGTAGRYYLANPTPVPASMGGWSIIVVYKNPNSKFRQIVITDGWQSAFPVETQINGLKIPASGTVNAVVGVTGTYGDRGYTDLLNFGKVGSPLTSLKDPMTGVTNDALNSTIAFAPTNNVSADGGPAISGNYTARNPISAGHLYGLAESYDFDADIFDATGVLSPSSTPVNVVLQQQSTGGDALVSGSYFISVDLATPPVLTKNLSVTSITDGGVAKYTWTVTNTAPDAVLQTINFTDNLPSSIKVASTPNASITGGTAGTITAVANSGVVTISGLQLNPGESATISVDITNVPGQLNASCSANPSAFTNSSSNITVPSGGILDTSTITPQCLLVTGNITYCYKPGITSGTALDSKVGITSLGRAGSTDPDKWPMVRKGSWMVLESKTKGFVVNRLSFDGTGNPVGIPATDFVEGMMVYDTTNSCMKIYTSTDGGTTFNWQCLTTQACPN